MAKATSPTPIGIFAEGLAVASPRDLVIAAFLGLLAAAFGILLMRGIAVCEWILLRTKLRTVVGPAFGGLIVGLLALISPQVMSSGHGALYLAGVLHRPLTQIAIVFVLKAIASVVSIGTGFRGGMFFASLLLGALGGQLLASGIEVAIAPTVPLDLNAYATVGMAALSASVIGAPFTMVFLALETTGDLWLTAAVLVAVIISSQVTAVGLLLRDVALPPSRRDHSQRRRCRLDARSHGAQDDAARRANCLGRPARVDVLPGLSSRIGEADRCHRRGGTLCGPLGGRRGARVRRGDEADRDIAASC